MIGKIYKSIKDYNDSGLSNLVANQGSRFLNKDGSFNVHKTGVPLMQRLSFFNALITMSWPRFLLIVVSTYFLLNLFFCVHLLFDRNRTSGGYYRPYTGGTVSGGIFL